MSVRKRKLKDGTVVYDAVMEYGLDGERRRTVKTFATKKEAMQADSEAKRYKTAARHRTGAMTLSEYIERHYWPVASRRLAATSLDTYEREIRLRIKPCLGNFMLKDLDRSKIQKMVDSCATEKVGRKAVSTLKTILNEAVGDGFMERNPATAKFAYPPKGKKRDNGLILADFGQIGEFIAVVQKDAPDAIVKLVMTGLMLGLRPEERYALDHDDFDLPRGIVTIKNAYVTASASFGGNQLKDTKTPLSNRTIPLPKPFLDWFMWTPKLEGAWIVNGHGERLSPSTAQKMWRRYLDGHPELPRVTLENMRHSFATSCLNAGMHVEDLSRMLGHSDINTTYRRYVKPDIANIRKGLELIPYPG